MRVTASWWTGWPRRHHTIGGVMRSMSGSRQMRAWVVDRPGPIAGRPLALVERPVPEPGPGQVRVRVSVCGVCRTDLHLAEGDLPPKHPAVTPGHEVVGRVDALGPGTSRFAVGQRIGAAWLAYTDMTCRFCMRGAENLCLNPRFTGWDQDGGYAEYLLVHEHYAYALPDSFADEQAAPLLCAGIIGYRALRQAALPHGGRLGIFGFGGSAHLVVQVAVAEGAEVHVFTRSAHARELAMSLGVGFGVAVRPRRLAHSGCAGGAGPWWNAGGRRHLRRRNSALELRLGPFSGKAPALGHRQYQS